MHTLLFLVFTSFSLFNRVLCASDFGSVFPIPLAINNNDVNFQHCPKESGAYAHTTNCSLFHMCNSGDHTIYSCIDGFFFHPTNGKCQYWPVEKETQCTDILKEMMATKFYPSIEPIKDYNYYNRRKSTTSKCTQAGIYPDVLDCSLFHYCHQNKQHEIFKCPNRLHFNPKTFMCAVPELVNCQYEPPRELTISKVDTNTTPVQPLIDSICRHYAPGTHLPVANKIDEFIVCENDGSSTSLKCKAGLIYNALTTGCESNKIPNTVASLLGPCMVDSNICKNNGQCVDEPTDRKGFKCLCSIQFTGDHCETPIKLTAKGTRKIITEETTHKYDSSTQDLLRSANFLNPKVEKKTIAKNSNNLLRYANLLQEKESDVTTVRSDTTTTSAANLLKYAALLRKKDSEQTTTKQTSNDLLQQAPLLQMTDSKETTTGRSPDNLLKYAPLLQMNNDEKSMMKTSIQNSEDLLQYAHRLLSKNSDDKTTNQDDLLAQAALLSIVDNVLTSNTGKGDFLKQPSNRVNTTIEDNVEEVSTASSPTLPYSRIESQQFRRFSGISQQRFPLDELIKTALIVILTLIGLVLLGLIIFGVTIFTRFVLCSSHTGTVGKWKVLTEESKV